MNALIKKDFRNNLTPIIASVLALIAPYLIAICVWTFTTESRRGPWDNWMVGAACSSLWMTAILAATYRGAAFAHERHERYADFLAMMPTSRSRVVLSKAIVSFVCLGSMIFINGLVFSQAWDGNRNALQTIWLSSTSGIMMFGVAWLCSSFLDSAAIAAGIGIGATTGCLALIGLIVSNLAGPDPRDILLFTTMSILTPLVGITAFLAGSMIFVRRIAP